MIGERVYRGVESRYLGSVSRENRSDKIQRVRRLTLVPREFAAKVAGAPRSRRNSPRVWRPARGIIRGRICQGGGEGRAGKR